MKREIKFRGLRTDGKGWVYGDLVRDKHLNGIDTLFFILTEKAKTFDDVIPVIPESVGQFTGLKDKNGVDIYEGDILNSNVYHREWFVEFTKCDGLKLAIKYNKEFVFDGIPQTHEQWSYNKVSSSIVTGNIHES